MTYEHYHKKPMSMCDIEYNQILFRNPDHINCLSRNTCYPMIRKTSHIH